MRKPPRALGLVLASTLAFSLLFVDAAMAQGPQASIAKSRGPNIVVLFMDDGGYGDLGCYGHPTIRTPNLDRMAAEGMRFTQFYSASGACTASRYALLTGRLPVRSGFAWVLNPRSKRGLHPKEVTIAEGLKSKGYATAVFGKWHLGHQRKYLPLQHGFDEYYGLPYSNDMLPPRSPPMPLIENNEVVKTNPDQTLLTQAYTEHAIDFITRHKEGPFFLYLPYAMPHIPLHPGKAFAGRSTRGTYGDVIEEIDWSVGLILDTLRKQGLSQKTLVLFTSDNGPWIIKGKRGGSSGLLRDGKGSTWEGGMREPAIAWWPGTVPAGQVEQRVACTIDVLPTAFELAGVDLPTDRSLDGESLVSVLRGNRPGAAHRPFFYYGPGNRLHAVRKGPWKLHIKTSSQTRKKYFDGKLPLLFQLDEDPSEKYDLADKEPEVVQELTELLEQHRKQVVAEGNYFKPGTIK